VLELAVEDACEKTDALGKGSAPLCPSDDAEGKRDTPGASERRRERE